jgi:chromosome partitioning protein
VKIIALLSQKGGAGKTTLAVHIATAAQLDGYPSAILDMDQQGTAEAWHGWREKSLDQVDPPVFPAKTPTLESMLLRLEKHGAKITLIDTAPLAHLEAIEAANCADLILIPCRPSGFDLHAIRPTVDLAKRSGRQTFAVLNAGPPRKATIYAESSKIISALGLELAPVHLSERAGFKQAVGSGRTVQEMNPSSKASEEVTALWRWIKNILKI